MAIILSGNIQDCNISMSFWMKSTHFQALNPEASGLSQWNYGGIVNCELEMSEGELVRNFPVNQGVIPNASLHLFALLHFSVHENKTLITSKLKTPQMEGYFGVFSTTGKQSIS